MPELRERPRRISDAARRLVTSRKTPLSMTDPLPRRGFQSASEPHVKIDAFAARRPHVPVELLGKSAEELRAFVTSLGEPAYRAAQLYRALYAERRFDFAAMTNLPADLRARLASAEGGRITLPRIVRRFQSVDGSIRYLLSIGGEDVKPAQIESVFMPREGRQTICISTQAGCAVDCHFCLTAQLGLIRNLTAGEIIGQVLVALEEKREHLTPQTNVVLMGQGLSLIHI